MSDGGVPAAGPGRIPPVADDATDAGLDAIFDVFRNAGREVPVLYRTLGHAPAMLQGWTDLAWTLRQDAAVPRGLRELVIMRVAQLTAAPFEWLAHWNMAVKHGVTEQQLAELSAWRSSAQFSDIERAVLEMTDELTSDLEVSDESWAALAARFPPGELVELVLTAAFYSCVSRVLHALRLGVVDESDPRLTHLRN